MSFTHSSLYSTSTWSGRAWNFSNSMAGPVAGRASTSTIKNNIFNAAKQAKKEQRLLESKILYSFLGMQFPEFLPLVQPHLEEIGQEAVVSLADIENSAMLDLTALGLDAGTEGQGSFHAAVDSKEYVSGDVIVPDVDKDGNEDTASVVSNRESTADTLSTPLEVDEEGVPDFSF